MQDDLSVRRLFTASREHIVVDAYYAPALQVVRLKVTRRHLDPTGGQEHLTEWQPPVSVESEFEAVRLAVLETEAMFEQP